MSNLFKKGKKGVIDKEATEQLVTASEPENDNRFSVKKWFDDFDSSDRETGLGFITENNFHIVSTRERCGEEITLPALFMTMFNESIETVMKSKKSENWEQFIPTDYNTVIIALYPIFKALDISLYLPENINEYQRQVLTQIGKDVDLVNETYANKSLIKMYDVRIGDDRYRFKTIDELFAKIYDCEVREKPMQSLKRVRTEKPKKEKKSKNK